MLTSDKKRLSIFDEGIIVDQNLPKWVNAKARAEANKNGQDDREREVKNNYTISYRNTDDREVEFENENPMPNLPINEEMVRDDVLFNEIASATLNELSDVIYRKKIYKSLSNYYGVTPNVIFASGGSVDRENNGSKKEGIFEKLIASLANRFKKKIEGEIDIAEFFTNIKLLSKESAVKYRDRVSNYLQALRNAKMAGQTALLETLLREMIANKYESLLDAEGFYYAVREEDVVRFAKKTEKGLKLSYIQNFGRPIPEDVVKTLTKANQLEVFDNYVVLYYDPKGDIYKETEKQRARRKDPILFGVISGSNKLYYIGDWIDEYCDLTLEKFVDTLGTTKEALKIFKD